MGKQRDFLGARERSRPVAGGAPEVVVVLVLTSKPIPSPEGSDRRAAPKSAQPDTGGCQSGDDHTDPQPPRGSLRLALDQALSV